MIENIFRSLFFFFDQLIYGFIPTIYNFMITLAQVRIFSDGAVKDISNNIYQIIGFFMLFKLAFSLLQAIVTPDLLTDKEKGTAKIFTRSIVALVLIVVIPLAFQVSWFIQQGILGVDKEGHTNLIVKVLIGNTDTSTAGYILATTSLSAFLNCSSNNCRRDHAALLNTVYTPSTTTTDLRAGLAKIAGILNDRYGDNYSIDYTPVISTIVGVFVVIMLITFTFDVALRCIKLAFLQVISPIAVVSYVDPKSSQSGTFKKWLDVTVSTYIGLFIRIAALAFVILVMGQFPNIDQGLSTINGANNQPITSEPLTVFFIHIFLVMGVLMFVKEAPKMFADLFGLKEGSLGSLNPFKRMAGGALIGAGAALGMKGTAGLLGGLGGGLGAWMKGGSFRSGLLQGANQGLKSVKVGEAYKKGFGGLAGTLKGSTFGAYGKGRDYSAGKVTGKEEHGGIINAIKGGVSGQLQAMHQGAATGRGFDLRNQILATAKKDGLESKLGKVSKITANDNTGYRNFGDLDAATKAKYNKTIFRNKDFANAYEGRAIAKADAKAAKQAMTEAQSALTTASAKYTQSGDPRDLAALQKAQEAVELANKEVVKSDRAVEQASTIFDEVSARSSNIGDVRRLAELERIDNELDLSVRRETKAAASTDQEGK